MTRKKNITESSVLPASVSYNPTKLEKSQMRDIAGVLNTYTELRLVTGDIAEDMDLLTQDFKRCAKLCTNSSIFTDNEDIFDALVAEITKNTSDYNEAAISAYLTFINIYEESKTAKDINLSIGLLFPLVGYFLVKRDTNAVFTQIDDEVRILH